MWELVRANQRRAAILVAVLAGLLLAVGYALGELAGEGGGFLGIALAGLVWIVLTLISYFAGDRIVLAASRARRIRKEDHPVLWNVVEEMSIAAGLAKVPEIYILDEAAPNAFATGRSPERAAVVVTAGLLERLDRDELQGVIAHELAHVKNRDVLYMTLVGVMLGAIVILADLGTRALFYGGWRRTSRADRSGAAQAVVVVVALLLIVLAPIVGRLVYLAVSRRREYLADASSALFTRYPEGLARALEKIAAAAIPLRAANRATAPMFIVNPLKVTAKGLADLTSTHPPTSERVRILRSLGGRLSLEGYDEAFRKVTGRPVGVVPAAALAALAPVPARAGSPPDPRPSIERVRETTDALWRLQDYAFISCPCGTSIKVPPAHGGKEVACPHCGRRHRVPPPALS